MSDEELPNQSTNTESVSPESTSAQAPSSSTEQIAPPPPVQTPWWVSDAPSMSSTLSPLVPVKRVAQVAWYMALAMSLIAGLVGALVGKVAFDNSPHLVTSNKVIDRAPGSIAGIAAKVSPSVVEIDSTTSLSLIHI